jgi:hypothetical protein
MPEEDKKIEALKKLYAAISDVEAAFKDDPSIIKESQDASTATGVYQDESGHVFSAVNDIIMKGYKPKGKIKGVSLSSTISNPNFGKVKS